MMSIIDIFQSSLCEFQGMVLKIFSGHHPSQYLTTLKLSLYASLSQIEQNVVRSVPYDS